MSKPKVMPRTYTFAGQTHKLSDWARLTGTTYETLRERIEQAGWSIEDALTIPIQHATQHKCRARNRQVIARIASAFHEARA